MAYRLLKYLAILLACITLPFMSANAAAYMDRVEVCYEFDEEDDLIDRDICILSTSSGAGVVAYTILYKGEKHSFFYDRIKEEEDTYYRNLFLDVIRDDEKEDFFRVNTQYLVCFPKKPYDICYTHERD